VKLTTEFRKSQSPHTWSMMDFLDWQDPSPCQQRRGCPDSHGLRRVKVFQGTMWKSKQSKCKSCSRGRYEGRRFGLAFHVHYYPFSAFSKRRVITSFLFLSLHFISLPCAAGIFGSVPLQKDSCSLPLPSSSFCRTSLSAPSLVHLLLVHNIHYGSLQRVSGHAHD